jgi:hypothetical protein
MRLASEIRAAKAPLKIPQLFLLPKLFKLRAPALFRRAEFGSESRAEILRLEHLPDFNLPFAAVTQWLRDGLPASPRVAGSDGASQSD